MAPPLKPEASGIFLWVFALSVGLLVLGIVALNPSMKVWLLEQYGYYAIFVTFFLWLSSMPLPRLTRHRSAVLLREHGPVALMALILVILAVVVCPPAFRNPAEEAGLSGIAMNMHARKVLYTPREILPGTEGIGEIVEEGLERRPMLFPFLINLVHSLLGWREANVFLLNGFLGFLLFFFFYFLLRRWFPGFLAVSGMCLLASIPLVVLWVTSGGLEIANLLFIVLAFLAFERFLVFRSARHAEYLILTLLVLAATRFESFFFALPMLLCIVGYLRHEEVRNLTGRLIVAPLLLLPTMWQWMSVTDTSAFGLFEGNSAFNTQWLGPNFLHALDFFWGSKLAFGMIPWISFGAMIGAGILVGQILKKEEDLPTPQAISGLVAVVSIVLQASITFLSYRGSLGLPSGLRHGLVFMPFVVLLNLFLIQIVTGDGRRNRWLVGVCIACFFFYYWPVANANTAMRNTLIVREYQEAKNWFGIGGQQKDLLLVSYRPGLFIPGHWNVISYDTLVQQDALIKKRIADRAIGEVIAHQCVRRSDGKPVNPDTTVEIVLGSGWKSEPLYQKPINEEYDLRLLRLIPGKNEGF